MPQVRSQTTWIPAHAVPARSTELAQAIDKAIETIGADRDVIQVALAPVETGLSDGESPTCGVLVTVVWRDG